MKKAQHLSQSPLQAEARPGENILMILTQDLSKKDLSLIHHKVHPKVSQNVKDRNLGQVQETKKKNKR